MPATLSPSLSWQSGPVAVNPDTTSRMLTKAQGRLAEMWKELLWRMYYVTPRPSIVDEALKA